MAVSRVLHCTPLAALLAMMALPMARVSAGAPPLIERPYYSYLLYLRAEPNRNLVAEAEAIALPLLKRHRLVDAAASKTWDRTGQAPISFEQRSRPQEHYDKTRTSGGESTI